MKEGELVIANYFDFPDRCRRCKYLCIDHWDMNGAWYRCYANMRSIPSDDNTEGCNSFRYRTEQDREADKDIMIERIKDCTTCRYGRYNDHWHKSFCCVDGDCHDWNLWEKQDDTELLETKLLDAMVDLWVKDDAPEWVRTKVREELAQQRSKEMNLK